MIKILIAYLTLIISLFISHQIYGQRLQPANPYELNNAPLWVQKLYENNPNVHEIDK